MMKLLKNIALLQFVFSSLVFSQANEKQFGLSVNLNYTATSKLYLQPNAVDQFIRNTHEELNGINSYSADFRYRFSEEIIVGIGSELIKKTFDSSINLSGIKVPMTDGYQLIPVEFSAYYLIPFSNKQFKFFMGGGFGVYFGKHLRNIADVSVSNEKSKVGYGIHVAVGMDFVYKSFFSVRGQMRFRDPEFEMTSKYSGASVYYNERRLTFPSQTFSSKVNIDGVTFTIGVVFNF